MNARERGAFTDDQADYYKLDNFAYSALMQANRLNPKKKNLAETGGYNKACDFLQHLMDRHDILDEVATSTHRMHYPSFASTRKRDRCGVR